MVYKKFLQIIEVSQCIAYTTKKKYVEHNLIDYDDDKYISNKLFLSSIILTFMNVYSEEKRKVYD